LKLRFLFSGIRGAITLSITEASVEAGGVTRAVVRKSNYTKVHVLQATNSKKLNLMKENAFHLQSIAAINKEIINLAVKCAVIDTVQMT
jgi:hypothetical protein